MILVFGHNARMNLADRVQFEEPPVVEVACGISFPVPANFRTAHVGLFWDEVRSDFPQLEEATPLLRAGEDAESLFAGFGFDGFPVPRSWMICADGSALIQLQKDRLIYNWKAVEGRSYPSYDAVIVEFEKHLKTFNVFLDREGLGEINANQMELTYVNHCNMELLRNDPDLLIDHTRHVNHERFLPPPERFFWSTIYLLPDDFGELQVSAQRARIITSGQDIIKLDLCARGLPTKGRSQREWFDLAHEWITRGFADITGRKTQKEIWRRRS